MNLRRYDDETTPLLDAARLDEVPEPTPVSWTVLSFGIHADPGAHSLDR